MGDLLVRARPPSETSRPPPFHPGLPSSPDVGRRSVTARTRVTTARNCHGTPAVRHPAAMVGPRQPHTGSGTGAPWVPALLRGADQRVTALSLAAALFLGGLAGTTRLLADGLVREGAARWEYGGVMGLCLAASVVLAVRRMVGRGEAFALVLLGNLIYVAVVLALDDPGRYASPLILLFPCFVGPWFLGPWQLAANMVLTTAACTAGLWPGHVSAAGLALEVVVNAGTLIACALAIFLIRRRVARLLVATEMLSNLDPLTGLANRRYLVQQAPRMWRQARRDGIRVAAMVLDLDHFKRLNDAHGHAAGDAVLQAVSHALADRPSPRRPGPHGGRGARRPRPGE